jgi:hypothetical protein
MKRTSLALLCFLITFLHAVGQDSLKVKAGEFSTELNINPFQGELSLNNTLNQIKVRYFLKDDFALRVGFIFSNKKDETKIDNPYGTNPFSYEAVKKSNMIGLNLGVEKHFLGTKKLSPYLAGEFSIGSKKSNHTFEQGNIKTEIDGAWQSVANPPNNYFVYDERGFTKFGINLVAGFDYYISRHFFFGYEFNFELSKTKFSDIDITTDDNNQQDTQDRDDSSVSIGPNLINGIRLGFIF